MEGPFKTLITDYGSRTTQEKPEETADVEIKDVKKTKEVEGDKLHMEEDREKGSVSYATYTDYMGNMGHWSFVLVLGIIFLLAQASSIANILWLGWWAGRRFDLSNGVYMGVYAGKSLEIEQVRR